MWRGIQASLLFLLMTTAFGGAAAQSQSDQPRATGMEDVATVKQAMLGNWESIAPEIRPSKNPDGSMKPFFLKRAFKYLPADRFARFHFAFGIFPIRDLDIDDLLVPFLKDGGERDGNCSDRGLATDHYAGVHSRSQKPAGVVEDGPNRRGARICADLTRDPLHLAGKGSTGERGNRNLNRVSFVDAL